MSITMIHGDSTQVMESVDPYVQLFIADLPYNINFDYGGGYDDNKDHQTYLADMTAIARACLNKAKKGASFFVIHYAPVAADLKPLFEATGWKLHQWLTWTYPSNVGHSKKRFTKASRAVLWFSNGDPLFNHKATTQPFKNPNDKRIKKLIANGSTGASHYDHWSINLCKNVSSDYAGYFNQIPYELLERIILHCSNVGDIVLDPCAGSGSTAVAADKLGREGVGIDLSPVAVKLWDEAGYDVMVML